MLPASKEMLCRFEGSIGHIMESLSKTVFSDGRKRTVKT